MNIAEYMNTKCEEDRFVNTAKSHETEEPQKTAILGTAHILRKVEGKYRINIPKDIYRVRYIRGITLHIVDK
jgi:hypothetical protein